MTDLALPQSARVDKFIAKSKFYDKAVLSPKLQDEFVHRIQKITWKYKLSEDTIGIRKTKSVTEIQVFRIELKEKIIPYNALKVIDKAIPYQILYQFVYGDDRAYGITLKGESASPKSYYFSQWNETPAFDFTGLDLEKLYQKIVKLFVAEEAAGEGDFQAVIALDNQIKRLEQEIARLETAILREKQFNKKVALNKTLLAKKKQLQSIRDTSHG